MIAIVAVVVAVALAVGAVAAVSFVCVGSAIFIHCIMCNKVMARVCVRACVRVRVRVRACVCARAWNMMRAKLMELTAPRLYVFLNLRAHCRLDMRVSCIQCAYHDIYIYIYILYR